MYIQFLLIECFVFITVVETTYVIKIHFSIFLYNICSDISIMVIATNSSISENLDIIFCLSFHAKYMPVDFHKLNKMGTLHNFIMLIVATISPLLKYSKHEIQTCIKISGKFELEMSSSEKKMA